MKLNKSHLVNISTDHKFSSICIAIIAFILHSKFTTLNMRRLAILLFYFAVQPVHAFLIYGGVDSTTEFQQQNGLVGIEIFRLNSALNDTEFCTGTLITESIILTAAHCLATENNKTQISKIKVYFSLNMPSLKKTDFVEASHFVFDERYLTNNLNYDIGLIRLKSKAPLNFKSSRLVYDDPTFNFDIKKPVMFTGFGIANQLITQVIDVPNGTILELPIANAYATIGRLRQVDELFISKVLTTTKEFEVSKNDSMGTCHGDSGGPMFMRNEKNQLIQIGITSRGTNPNGNCDDSGIYTNINEFKVWIQNSIQFLHHTKSILK